MEQQDSVHISSASQISYCPYCGRETEREEKPIASTVIEGEEKVTRTNLEVTCPQHGIITVSP